MKAWKMMTHNLGLYIHIPFCEQRCSYCNFLTFIREDDKMDKYVDYVIKELALYDKKDYQLDTVYLGGGTPSYLPDAAIQRIMQAVNTYFELTPEAEVTIEMNPETVSLESLDAYLESGMNRFSMGIQSFNDEVLKIMGRLHRSEMIYEKLELFQKAGCQNVSIDLMFANPKQSMDVWKEDVAQALSQKIQHISAYSLMLKENTAYERWLEAGLIELADDETDRDMYHYLQEEIGQKGFHQYEISSFSLPGYEGRHNKKYWRQEDYLGIGMGASSSLGQARMTNVSSFQEYFDRLDAGQIPISEKENYDREDLEREYIMVKMRLLKGIDINEINQRFDIDFLDKYQAAIDKHLKLKTIQIKNRKISFTHYGLDVGNQFYLDII